VQKQEQQQLYEKNLLILVISTT